MNEIRALNALFREGGMSRADLARHLGLTRSTTSSIIGNLLAEGLVTERPIQRQQDSRTGRPGITVELERNGSTFIGAEIGVDRLTVVAVDLQGRIIAKRSSPYATASHTPGQATDELCGIISELVSLLPARTRVRGLAVAIPALIDGDQLRSAALIGWSNVPLASLLRQRLPTSLDVDVPILIENDANAFAMAETYSGTSRRSDTVAFFLIESGAGGGIVTGGRLFRGANGVAGEFGHLPVQCGRGGAGASTSNRLEHRIGKSGVLRSYGAAVGSPVTLDDLMGALERRDDLACKVAAEWGRWLACGLVHIVNIIDPGLVIIGGSVGAIFGHVGHVVEAELQRQLSPGQLPPRIELSRFGDEGAAFGGAFLIHQRMFSIDEAVFPSELIKLRPPS
jgi:predicted NBD/HSP70 family sugar kinase